MFLRGKLVVYIVHIYINFRITEAAETLEVFVPDGPVYVRNGDVLTINISYQYSGNGKALITWQRADSTTALVIREKDGTIVKSDDRATIINDGDLVLNNTTLSDNTTYRVTIQISVSTGVKTLGVIVSENPVAIYNCSSLSPNENANLSCLCTSSGGNPPPSVVWLKDGKQITSEGFLQQTLTITNASKNDAGIYTCNATSYTLSDIKKVTILVKYKPIIELFTINSISKYVVRGSSVLFTCKVDAYPPVKSVKLYHNGSEIGDFKNGQYTIRAVNSTYNGNYQCVAENLQGKTKSREVVVKVADKPKASSNCTNTNNTYNEGDKISCTCGGGNNVPIAEAWWIHNKVKSLLNPPLDRVDDGAWTCHVRSHQNLTDKITITIKVIYPTTLPTSVPAVIVSSTKATEGDKNNLGDNNNGCIAWYIAVITFLCGLLIGAVVTYVVIKLRHRVTKQRKQQQNNNMYDDVIPSEAQPPVYQELNLKDMNQPENYQALKREVGGGGRSNNGLDVKDSNYQELNNPRGRSADNYQTLQKT